MKSGVGGGADTTPRGITDSDYEACLSNLGLLEGEEIRLQYVGTRPVVSVSAWDGNQSEDFKPGLLVFTNDNMVFMQREKAGDFAQALRIPLENINGLVTGGTFIHHVLITVGTAGIAQQIKFNPVPIAGSDGKSILKGREATLKVRADVEKLLKDVREEKRRLATEALAKGVTPAMVFCKFCGSRNKADQLKCVSCGAPL